MAGFLKNLASGIGDIVTVAQAAISPFKVQAVSQDKFKGYTILSQDGCLRLYGRFSAYECVACKRDGTSKMYSVFRQTNESDARTLYKSLITAMMPLITGGIINFNEETLQKLTDCIRDHPVWTSAHVAAYLGYHMCLKHPGVKENIDVTCSMQSVTPLMTAIIGKQMQAVEDLLKLGATLGKEDASGNTAYHYSVLNCPPLVALLTDYDKQGVINWLNGKGESALLLACQLKLSDATEMLIGAGADPRVATADCLPIHAAVKSCDMKSIEAIVKAYPDQANAKDYKYGATPLHWAENRDTIHKLSMLGCDMNIVNNEGHAPLHVMMIKKRSECLMSLLCHGANCNILDSTGESVLHTSIQQDDLDLVRLFVVFGADVNQKDPRGNTPRHMAATSKGKNKETILYLLHVSGAKRCDKTAKGCLAGCVAEGNHNGVADQTMAALMKLDSMALFDEQLSATVVTSGHSLSQSQQGAVFDMIDAPMSVGDRVLCLDGGGIRGLVLIQILMEIETAVGKPIQECFDWIGGTSTGGILALGIAQGYSLKYMKGLYVRLKDEVFQGKRPYDCANFEEMLKREFGEESVMSDIKHPRLLVTAVLGDRFPSELHFFRNYEPTLQRPSSSVTSNDAEKKPSEQKVWEVGRSSGAAPTYFRGFGPFIDGGLMSNNPTLDVLTEIHEYNTGLKMLGRAKEAKPIGCVISLGCGRCPTTVVKNTDVFVPSGLFDVYKSVSGASALGKLMIDQATISEGRPVDRSRAWCSMMNIPFYRFSPLLSEDLPLDCHSEPALINMIWETHCYMVAHRHRLQELATLLRAGGGSESPVKSPF